MPEKIEQGAVSAVLVPLYNLCPQLLGGDVHPDDAIIAFNEKVVDAKAFLARYESQWRGDYIAEFRQWLKDCDHIVGALAQARLQDRHKHRPGASVIGRAIGRLDTLASSGEVDLRP